MSEENISTFALGNLLPRPVIKWWSKNVGQSEDNPIRYTYDGTPIKFNGYSWTYNEIFGDSEPLTATVTIDSLGETTTIDLDITYEVPEIVDAGTHIILAKTAGLSGQYEASVTPIYISVFKGSQEITDLTFRTWEFGNPPAEPLVKVKYGDASGVTYAYEKVGSVDPVTDVKPTDVGDYILYATAPGTSNYSSTTKTFNFTISQATTRISFLVGSSPDQFATLGTYGGNIDSVDDYYTVSPNIDYVKNKLTKTIYFSKSHYSNSPDEIEVNYIQNAGYYRIALKVQGNANFTSVEKSLYAYVNKAEDNEITQIIVEDWYEGGQPHILAATAKYGNASDIVYTYSDSPDGPYTSTPPTVRGSYYVKATIPGTDNYNEAEAVAPFNVLPKLSATFLWVDAENETGKSNDNPIILDFKNSEYTAEYFDKHPPLVAELEGADEYHPLTITYTCTLPNGWFKDVGLYTLIATTEAGNYKGQDYPAATTSVYVQVKQLATEIVIKDGKTQQNPVSLGTYQSIEDYRQYYEIKPDKDFLQNLLKQKWYFSKTQNGLYTSTDYIDKAGYYRIDLRIEGDDNIASTESSLFVYINKADNVIYSLTIDGWDYGTKDEDLPNPVISAEFDKESAVYTYTDSLGHNPSDERPRDAGDYCLIATIPETDNYNEVSASTEFEIKKSRNEITNLTIVGWIEGDNPNEPSAESKFGTIIYTYSDSPNGPYTEKVPENAGTYYVKAKVEETDNYFGDSLILQFKISKRVYVKKSWKDVANETGSAGDRPVELYFKNSEYTLEYFEKNSPLIVELEGTDEYRPLTITYTLPDYLPNPLPDGWLKNAGLYTLIATTEAGNYNGQAYPATETSVYVQIKQATDNEIYDLTISSWTYGEKPKAPSATAKYGDASDIVYTYSDSEDDWDDASTVPPTNTGTYYVKATIPETPNYNSAENIISFGIAPAYNEITEFVVENWEVEEWEGFKSPTPTIKANFGASSVEYTYSDSPNDNYKKDEPRDIGTYYIKATIPETDNYYAVEATRQFKVSKLVGVEISWNGLGQSAEQPIKLDFKNEAYDEQYFNSLQPITAKVDIPGNFTDIGVTYILPKDGIKDVGIYTLTAETQKGTYYDNEYIIYKATKTDVHVQVEKIEISIEIDNTDFSQEEKNPTILGHYDEFLNDYKDEDLITVIKKYLKTSPIELTDFDVNEDVKIQIYQIFNDGSTEIDKISGFGKYKISISFSENMQNDDNYDLDRNSQYLFFEITPYEPKIMVKNNTFKYNGQFHDIAPNIMVNHIRTEYDKTKVFLKIDENIFLDKIKNKSNNYVFTCSKIDDEYFGTTYQWYINNKLIDNLEEYGISVELSEDSIITEKTPIFTVYNEYLLTISRNKIKEIGIYQIQVKVGEDAYFSELNQTVNFEIERYVEVLNNNEVLQTIKNALIEVMEEDYYYYKDYKVIISKEQEFIKLKQAEPKAIYIVVKFGSASINFSQTVLPVTLTAMSEQNKLDVCQKLLCDFVNKYNLETNDDGTVRQIYELPVVTSNFNKVFEGFRSILFVNGFFVISKNANFFELEYYKTDVAVEYNESIINKLEINKDKFLQKVDYIQKVDYKLETYNLSYDKCWFLNGDKISSLADYGITIEHEDIDTSDVIIKIVVDEIIEKIPILTNNFSADFQLDSQPFYNATNFTESKAKYGTLSFNIVTFLLSDIQIINDALKQSLKQTTIDKQYKLKIKLKNGIELPDIFRLINVNSTQNIAEIPTISLGFTN